MITSRGMAEHRFSNGYNRNIFLYCGVYHLMQFQKLKHVVARYFDTKSSEKSKQKLRQPGPFIQIQI